LKCRNDQCIGVLREDVRRIRETRVTGRRTVLLAHAFVAGGEVTESERPLVVGGAGAVEPAGLTVTTRVSRSTATLRFPVKWGSRIGCPVKGAQVISGGDGSAGAVSSTATGFPVCNQRFSISSILRRTCSQ